jgi:hypothetical protein
MTDPREPGTPEDPGIALPSWVDDAIAKSRDEKQEEAAPSEAGPAGEIAVNPPPTESEPPPPADWQPVSHARATDDPPPIVVADGPRDARRRAVLPWVALALIFLGAALAIGYILLTRSVQR